jgi:hypothetical protein
MNRLATRFLHAHVIAMLIAAGGATLAHAEPATARIDTAVIDGGLAGLRGRAALNMTAGVLNLQANAAAIAAGGDAAAGARVSQTPAFDAPVSDALHSRSTIAGNAFANASGALAVNQSSGELNRQANVLTIGLSDGRTGELSDEQLSSVVSGLPQPLAGTALSGTRVVGVTDTAFASTRGIVQVNQAAGASNVSANVVSLRAAGLSSFNQP